MLLILLILQMKKSTQIAQDHTARMQQNQLQIQVHNCYAILHLSGRWDSGDMIVRDKGWYHYAESETKPQS